MQSKDLWHVLQGEVVSHVLFHAAQIYNVYWHHVASDAGAFVDRECAFAKLVPGSQWV